MSRNNAKRKAEKRNKVISHSTIEQHHRQGKRLVPPLANIPKIKPRSWSDNRLPEMLWASLLLTHLPREQVLDIFRELANYIHENQNIENSHDISHTGLSYLKPEQLGNLLTIITRTREQKLTLGSLLLLSDLPAKDVWNQYCSS
jgi:hypothetical protein